MNDMDEAALQRARETEQLMKNPYLERAFTDLEAQLTSRMINSKLEDVQVREASRYQLEAVRMVKQELRRVLETGKMIVQGVNDKNEMDAFLAEGASRSIE